MSNYEIVVSENLSYYKIVRRVSDGKIIDGWDKDSNSARILEELQSLENTLETAKARIAELEAKLAAYCKTCDGKGVVMRPFPKEGYSLMPFSCPDCGGSGKVDYYNLQLDALSSVTDANICELVFSDEDVPVDPLADFFANTPKAPKE